MQPCNNHTCWQQRSGKTASVFRNSLRMQHSEGCASPSIVRPLLFWREGTSKMGPSSAMPAHIDTATGQKNILCSTRTPALRSKRKRTVKSHQERPGQEMLVNIHIFRTWRATCPYANSTLSPASETSEDPLPFWQVDI